MSYHQWLNSTSKHAYASTTMDHDIRQSSDTATQFETFDLDLDDGYPIDILTPISLPSNFEFEASMPIEELQPSDRPGEIIYRQCDAGCNTCCRPTMRLSDAQYPTGVQTGFQQLNTSNRCGDGLRYGQTLSQSTGCQCSDCISRSLMPCYGGPNARDQQSLRPPSLAATHPANYGPQLSKQMMPPPPLPPKHQMEQTLLPPSPTSPPRFSFPQSALDDVSISSIES